MMRMNRAERMVTRRVSEGIADIWSLAHASSYQRVMLLLLVCVSFSSGTLCAETKLQQFFAQNCVSVMALTNSRAEYGWTSR